MNNAAGLLFAFLAVLVSCISLEKVLLQLMKKKKRTCRTSYFQQHWDSRGGVRCCRQTRSAIKQNSVTRYAAAEGSDLSHSPTPTLTFAELFAEVAHLAALAASYTFSAQLY